VFSEAQLSLDRKPVGVPKQLDWLLFGGGSEPLSNQVSLAQDLGLAGELLAGSGLTLFASGPGAPLAVEEHARTPAEPPDLDHALAQMFGVPGTDATRYEPSRLAAAGPSTTDQVLHVLERALEQGTGPLFVYAACHGDRGERPSDNSLALWGGWSLKVSELAALLDRAAEARGGAREPAGESPRGTRFVITSCFGGGFAELAFLGADPKRGARSPDHCGLFAAPWDEEASGCDPNPDRRRQESYAIHFLHALAGQDRRGVPHLREIDLDADGRVSLLEAHTYARVESRSFDLPTTTSERFLREVVRTNREARLDPLSAPEEVAIVRALGEELDLATPAQANAKLQELERILDDADAEVEKAQKRADDAYYALRIALLERFPLLEHPWEQRTRDMLAQHGPEILRLLTASELAAEQRRASEELDQAVADQDSVRVARARVMRLVRAFETLRLASALKTKGGPQYAHYQALRRCENWVPPLRTRVPGH
jgi:hypothetical protein